MSGIFSRISQRIGILRLVKRIFVDTSVLIRCYYAFVLPFLEYCIPVWGSAAERQVYSVAMHAIALNLRAGDLCTHVIAL